jgi:SH3-like domain-containing protein
LGGIALQIIDFAFPGHIIKQSNAWAKQHLLTIIPGDVLALMDIKRLIILLAALTLVGCAGPAPSPPLPHLELPVNFYVGAIGLHLKASPDPSSADVALVRLNERVKKVKRSGAWFLVQANSGQEGWANEKNLELNKVSQLYVRQWGVRLRSTPAEKAKTVARLRLNDKVKLLEQNDQGWARVTVDRTQDPGWLELDDLSLDRVVVRRPAAHPSQPVQGAETSPVPLPPTLLTPAPAEAAPPPPVSAPPQPEPSPLPGHRKVKPEMFEPF